MGYYINPTDGKSKEEFLKLYGTRIEFQKINKEEIDYVNGPLPVCLINNGPFTAAAIAFCSSEVEAFSLPSDYRPKTWYMVPKEYLAPFLPMNMRNME